MADAAERLLTVAQELAEVSRLVDDDDAVGALDRFAARLVGTVPGCAAASVTIRVDSDAETVAAAANGRDGLPVPSVCELGPIIEALQHREPRRLDDTHTDQRWPRFSARRAAEGYRSCLVIPVPAQRAASPAVLTLYSTEPHRFDETVHDIVLLLTLHAGVVFDNAKLFHDSWQLVEQLTQAIENRQVIGQAQGLLMRHVGCDSARGFQLLKAASQNTNTKLRDVAVTLVGAHEKGEFSHALARFGVGPDSTAAAYL
ncbi:MAG TPA: GAF and ANTAR domain-containing protein [Pseudonocardia sp.]|jgi:GAF domain-containing protein|uniref:GAF and ANTAR domain-containing protein n=1 Tax=Pseudonocardia sp. TaxID=60912 RepID=UPI002B4B7B6F|nr:GAF and ANTAR domain-containing protein [Pseudonocardia sp.]HLU59366.1 GAF and ANTAR domain-containing protein [Pseudonocardia sp.]